MATPTRSFVLLLSRAPSQHMEVIRSFRRSGATVSTAMRPERALALLRRVPSLVLVDLAHGARLTPALIRALNSGRRRPVVLALHDGSLEHVEAGATSLSVDGFCRANELAAHARIATGAAFPAAGAVH